MGDFDWGAFANKLGGSVQESGQMLAGNIMDKQREERKFQTFKKQAKVGLQVSKDMALYSEELRRQGTEWNTEYRNTLQRSFGDPEIEEALRMLEQSGDEEGLERAYKTRQGMRDLWTGEDVDAAVFSWLGDKGAPIMEAIKQNKFKNAEMQQKKLEGESLRAYRAKMGNFYDEQAKAFKDKGRLALEAYLTKRSKFEADALKVYNDDTYRMLEGIRIESGWDSEEFRAKDPVHWGQWIVFKERYRATMEPIKMLDAMYGITSKVEPEPTPEPKPPAQIISLEETPLEASARGFKSGAFPGDPRYRKYLQDILEKGYTKIAQPAVKDFTAWVKAILEAVMQGKFDEPLE